MWIRARPDSGCGQPGCQVYRRRDRQPELRLVTEARKVGGVTSLAAADGVAGACRVLGAVAVTVGRCWLSGPGTPWPGEQAATHATVSAAAVTSGAWLLTVSGS